jgi:hypothetical protein
MNISLFIGGWGQTSPALRRLVAATRRIQGADSGTTLPAKASWKVRPRLTRQIYDATPESVMNNGYLTVMAG